ncbi:MAG: hypothetical protein QOG15_215 [Solirubrobacteraceae bacterium]|jgi:hypothetical protein|nr:hypothetical protein [Solirubrobacteraceae bacterium]
MTARRAAWALCGISIALVAGGIVLFFLNDFRSTSGWGTGAEFILLCAPMLAFPVVGALIGGREPRNAVGWICLVAGFSLAVLGASGQYALYAIETNPGGLPGGETAAWIGEWAYVPAVVLLGIYLPMLFPAGRLLSRRWRLVAWLGAVSAVTSAAGAAFLPGPLEDSVASVDNPYAIAGTEPLNGGFGLMALCFLAAAVSMVIRLRRSTGIEREQVKWFSFAAVVLAALFGVEILTGVFLGVPSGPLEDVVTVCFAFLPIATGIAILRYRLYDIDVVINRTLVYGALTGTLAATYLGSVLLLQLVLSGVTASNSLAVAVSTLVVAAAFQPVRHRIQAGVDRRFFRRKYDAGRTLERFGARLRDEIDLDALGSEMRGVVHETMQPAHVSLWLRAPEAGR